jgi:hypothetical protein
MLKDELNPEIWSGDQMAPEVRRALLRIAQEFLEYLGLENIKDVTVTGSLANYNWSSHSDIDLHVIVDYAAIDENPELVKDLFIAKKSLWNDSHEVMVKGFEVECYPQDSSEPHHSSGIYSLLHQDWIVRPDRKRPTIDSGAVREKSIELMQVIDDAIGPEECDSVCIDRVKEKIKKMRQCGLETGGEFSIENLAFKVLRRNGYIAKLWDASTEKRDLELSLEAQE